MSVSQYYDLNAAAAVMKELYSGQKVQSMVFRKNPFFALVPKTSDFKGKVFPQPIITAGGAGRSATFLYAQSNQTAAQSYEFMVKRVRDYAIYSIDNETMMAADGDRGSFVSGIKVAADEGWRGLQNSMGSSVFRSGTGSVGQIASISTGVITFTNKFDAMQFALNQTVQANATDGGTPRAALGYVISRNVMAGTITVSASALGGSAGTPSGWTTSDFLLIQGDNNLKMAGLAGWLPSADPTSGDSWFGVDRSVDVVALAGLRYDGSSEGIEEALIDSAAYLDAFGGDPRYGITGPLSFAALEKSLGSKVQYTDLKMGEIGFRGIQVNAPNGVITILSDRNCQALTCYLLTMDTWDFKSLGEAPQELTYGDGKTLRIANADAVEGRLGYYGNLICNAPGWNAVVKLGA